MKKSIIALPSAILFLILAAAAPAASFAGIESLLSDPAILGSLGALTGGGGGAGELTSILTEDPAFLQEAMKLVPELLNKAKAKFSLEEQAQIAKAIEEAMSGAGLMSAIGVLTPIIPQVKAIVDALKNKDQSVMAPGGAVDQVLDKLKSSNLIKIPASLTDKFYASVREAAGEAVGMAPAVTTNPATGGITVSTGGTTVTTGPSGTTVTTPGTTVSTGTGGSSTTGSSGAIPGLDTSTLGGSAAGNPAAGSPAGGVQAGTSGGQIVSGTGAQVGTAAGQPGTPAGAVSAAEAAAAAAAEAKQTELEERLKKIREKIKLALDKVKILQKELPKMYPPLRIPGASAAHLNIKNVAMLLRARYRARTR